MWEFGPDASLIFEVLPGTISIYGASDFSHFFNMEACLNVSTTSSYRCTVGLTKRSPIIRTQTLSLHNTRYDGYGKYNLTDVHGLCDFPHFLNSAARRYYTRTSRYRTLLGLTKLASVIQTQTLHQTNTTNMALLVYYSITNNTIST